MTRWGGAKDFLAPGNRHFNGHYWMRNFFADSPTISGLSQEFITLNERFFNFWVRNIEGYIIKGHVDGFPIPKNVNGVIAPTSGPEFPFIKIMTTDGLIPMFKGLETALIPDDRYRGTIYNEVIQRFIERSKDPRFYVDMQQRMNKEYEKRLSLREDAAQLNLDCSDSNLISDSHSNPYRLKYNWTNYIKYYYYEYKNYISEFRIIKFIQHTGLIEFFINHFYYFIGFGLTITLITALFIIFVDKLYKSEDIKKIEEKNKKE